MADKLEILVVEDTPRHQEAARQLLSEHNIKIVSTFDEACKNLGTPWGFSGFYDEASKYDVVLTDMFYTERNEKSEVRDTMAQVPFGYALSLLAIQRGVPYVAIVSDINHHNDCIAASMDHFRTGRVLQLANSRLGVINDSPSLQSMCITEEGEVIYSTELEKRGIKFNAYDGSFPMHVKDWKEALDFVMKGEVYVPKREAFPRDRI